MTAKIEFHHLARSGLSILCLAAAGLTPVQALAHAHLEHAEPAAGSTVPAGIDELDLAFSEPVEPRFSGIEILGADGKPIPGVTTDTAPNDPTTLIAHAHPALPPGAYQVNWHVLSVDTHKTNGTYKFTIATPDAEANHHDH
jgi:methionine-rich copper-binding protein CopC